MRINCGDSTTQQMNLFNSGVTTSQNKIGKSSLVSTALATFHFYLKIPQSISSDFQQQLNSYTDLRETHFPDFKSCRIPPNSRYVPLASFTSLEKDIGNYKTFSFKKYFIFLLKTIFSRFSDRYHL